MKESPTAEILDNGDQCSFEDSAYGFVLFKVNDSFGPEDNNSSISGLTFQVQQRGRNHRKFYLQILSSLIELS
jgi:hypothetical protein